MHLSKWMATVCRLLCSAFVSTTWKRQYLQVVSGLLEPIAEDRLTAARARRVLDGQDPVRGERGYVPPRPPAAQIGGLSARSVGDMVVPQPVDALGMPMQVHGAGDACLSGDVGGAGVSMGVRWVRSTWRSTQVEVEVPTNVRKPTGARSSVTRRGMNMEVRQLQWQ